jgi:hypothetical protein
MRWPAGVRKRLGRPEGPDREWLALIGSCSAVSSSANAR